MVIRINLPGDYTRCGRWFKKDVGGAIGLGIFRSDYLLHCSDPDSNITEGRKGINGPGLEIKQVEFNMVSVIYYRSMYGPEYFMTEDHWLARYRLERSQSVKCPSLSVQLAGCKKFQQVLTDQNFTLMGAEAVWPINWGQTIRALLAMFSNLRLSLNKKLAGVTFLGFGNGAPDVFSTFVAMRSGTGSLAIGELIGAASFIVLIRDYSPGI
ncbi:hypothetical protein BY996DRAFT_6417514 [Phakopsora pachyrhizi]|nr:hypothetical protein BY996DRAFT_6417514 [Phakopsora pachyrhizi]